MTRTFGYTGPPCFLFDRRMVAGENSGYPFACRKKLNSQLGEKIMKKMIAVSVLCVCLSFVVGVAVADRLHDWHDLDAVHHHVEEAIRELDHARAANHYDMAGHGAKAEEHLHAAEHELHDAVEAIRAEH